MKIGPGVSELWGVENRPLPLTWPMVYITACTTNVQAEIRYKTSTKFYACGNCDKVKRHRETPSHNDQSIPNNKQKQSFLHSPRNIGFANTEAQSNV